MTKIGTGKLDANASSEEGEYPFFTCSKEPLRISSYSYDCECVLVAGNGDLNIKYYDGKFDAYQRTYIIEDNSGGKLCMRYLYYFMEGYVKELRKQAIGGVIKYIKLGNLEEAIIDVPPIEIQKKMVKIMDKTKSAVEDRKSQIEMIYKIVNSRFIELFGDLTTNSKQWDEYKLGDACKINPKKSDDNRLMNGVQISFVAMTSVSEKGSIDTSIIKLYDDVKKGYTYFAENDVLFAKITPCMENGKGAVAKGLKNGIGFGSTEFHVIRPIKGKTNAYWIYCLTMFEFFRQDAERKMTGSAGQRRVPASFLENYMVGVPPVALQDQFADFVQQANKLKTKIQNSLNETQTLFDSLMQKYFG